MGEGWRDKRKASIREPSRDLELLKRVFAVQSCLLCDILSLLSASPIYPQENLHCLPMSVNFIFILSDAKRCWISEGSGYVGWMGKRTRGWEDENKGQMWMQTAYWLCMTQKSSTYSFTIFNYQITKSFQEIHILRLPHIKVASDRNFWSKWKRDPLFPASIYWILRKSLIGHSYLYILEPITVSRNVPYSKRSNLEFSLEINKN